MTPEHQIHPIERIDRCVAEDLVRRYPDVFLLWHPIFERWQVYEGTRKSDWSAQRLVQVILAQHRYPDDPRAQWWRWRGAPVLVETLPPYPPPGFWLLEWLGERDIPVQEMLRRFEDREERWQRERKARMHDKHRAIADDARRHLRDAGRDDPLAGKRRWVISKTRDLEGART